MTLYSSIDPTQLLHIINRKRDIQAGRTDLVPADELLQCAVMRYSRGTTFRPHKHFPKQLPAAGITAESWIVISGTVQVTLYDLDDSILHTDVLEAGDISITVGAAGHNYLIMSEDVCVAEYKSGPYYGQSQDKIMIE